MNDIATNTGVNEVKWYIDVDWFEPNGRSLSILLQGCLCPKCYQKLKPNTQTVTNDRLMKTVKDCCSKTPEFIRDRMPVMESVFRLLLANGNKPLNQDDILKQLGERCGMGIYPVSYASLNSLLLNDSYYGISQALEK